MRIAHRILISAVRRFRLLILCRRWRVSWWRNKHRRVGCVQRRVFDATRGRLGIDVLARAVVWIRTRSPRGRRLSYLTRGTLHLLRLATARALAPGFLRVAFDLRIERVCIVFALLCFQSAPRESKRFQSYSSTISYSTGCQRCSLSEMLNALITGPRPASPIIRYVAEG